MAAIEATPAARPSMLSSRLKALVTPTIQTKATSRSMGAQPVTATGGISHSAIAATAIWPIELRQRLHGAHVVEDAEQEHQAGIEQEAGAAGDPAR